MGIIQSPWIQSIAAVLRIDAATYTDSETFPTDATVIIQFDNDGNVYVDTEGTAVLQYEWVTPTSAAANYEIRATVTASDSQGTLTGDVTNWNRLDTDRSWDLTFTGNGDGQRTLLFEIGLFGTSTSLESDSVNLVAESIP